MTQIRYDAQYTIATHDDENHYTSANGDESHACPFMAMMLAKMKAQANFADAVKNDETGMSGSGCCIMNNGYMDRIINGVIDNATYWSFEDNQVEKNYRHPDIVKKMDNKDIVKKTKNKDMVGGMDRSQNCYKG